jgi:hypothetical protein
VHLSCLFHPILLDIHGHVECCWHRQLETSFPALDQCCRRHHLRRQQSLPPLGHHWWKMDIIVKCQFINNVQSANRCWSSSAVLYLPSSGSAKPSRLLSWKIISF